MKKFQLHFILMSISCIITSCGDGGSVTKSINNTISAEPILGKWYPHESWLDDNNNNIEDTNEWHLMGDTYKQDLAKINMTMEDLAMTFLADGTGFVTAIKTDSTAFTWKLDGSNQYVLRTTEKGETSIMTGSIISGGILKTISPLQKEVVTEKAIKWNRVP
jgi:hypothetical protein